RAHPVGRHPLHVGDEGERRVRAWHAVEARVDEVVAELGDDRGIRVEGLVAVAEVLVDADHRTTLATRAVPWRSAGRLGPVRDHVDDRSVRRADVEPTDAPLL